MVQVRGFLLACPSPLSLGAVVLSTPVSCMQLSALLFFVNFISGLYGLLWYQPSFGARKSGIAKHT